MLYKQISMNTILQKKKLDRQKTVVTCRISPYIAGSVLLNVTKDG